MPSDPADQASRTGRPLLWVAGLVLLALLGGGGYLVLRGGTTAELPSGPSTSSTSEGDREAEAAALLDDLAGALMGGTRRDALDLAAADSLRSRRAVTALHANARALRVEDLTFRYIDEDAGALSARQQKPYGGSAWVADVEMSWRLRGFDDGVSRMEVSLTFVETGGGVALGDAGGDHGNPAPLWLQTRLGVERSPRSLVMVADRTRLDTFAGLADEAVADVKKVLPSWRGKLVVEVPRNRGQLSHMLDADESTYDAIAAVTTTVDGSLGSTSPTHIMVNPSVFSGLGEEGSQIVMSHEATHVATDAATTTMPMWLLEGFADYVALAHVDLPVSVTASQILAEVRRDGPPKSLPGESEFDPSSRRLGTSYESAWLACRLLAEEYGEGALIEFYRAVADGRSTEESFAQVLDTDERSFTRRWRSYLRELAS